MKKNKLILLLFLLSSIIVYGQENLSRQLNWTNIQRVQLAENVFIYSVSFDGATFLKRSGDIPVFSGRIPVSSMQLKPEVRIQQTVFEEFQGDITRVTGHEAITEEISIHVSLVAERKQPNVVYSFVPIRKNRMTGNYEKLVSFDVMISYDEAREQQLYRQLSYADISVLASGSWYKIAVSSTGIHKISYAELQQLGMAVDGIDPRNIRIYGNGGGMLPESLTQPRYDDLQENAILVSGENDGSFDEGDYILFYGESPHIWKYNSSSQSFYHLYNIYSEKNFYFITADLGSGKRIPDQHSTTQAASHIVTKFTDHQFHEEDVHNLVNTGRLWYGEVFDIQTTFDFEFSFPNLDVSSDAYLKVFVAGKSSKPTYFSFKNNGNTIINATINGIPPTSDTFARNYVGNKWFTPQGSNLTITVQYTKTTSGSIGWMNYLELNAVRFLKYTGTQMPFRDPYSAGIGNVSEFRVSNAGNNVTLWNVTDPLNIRKVIATQNGQEKVFRLEHDSIMEFIAFNGEEFFQVELTGQIVNQNLHGLNNLDMVIVSHPDFMQEANRLANFHRDHDGLKVYVTEPQLIYNEFSSGAQDITAIRDFIRMLYNRARRGQEPSYLLMFGDASFDYKDRIENNSNFVPTWEDEESLTIVYSIATDDFFGFLDESQDADNLLDIGLGRFPVETVDQAKNAVDKVFHYAQNSDEVMGEWRNYITFVADDGDGNLHLTQAEKMSKFFDTTYSVYNIDKIYVDAFPQITTAGGQRAPEVNKAINNRMEKGTLIINYTGHGGELGWAHERILENSDINSWTNFNMLPIFITATCEFSRYDDPERVAAGEYVFRNPEGGAIALFTTARATFGGSNFNLNTAMYSVMFKKTDGEYPRFGDIIREAKNKGGVADNDKKFILLGDPALRLAYPEFKVVTTSVNGVAVTVVPDTIKALSKVTVSGEIRDDQGNKMNSYNGILYPLVFDKPSDIMTLGTDPESSATMFRLQNNVLYKGKTNVANGIFSFTFIVPKDIGYNYGFGKISYYSSTDGTDAHGFYKNIVVGGYNEHAEDDKKGPEVALYMNDENFAFGGLTDENPILYALVSDENGINTVGSGIGHDIVAILDEKTDKPMVLNEYYEADLNSYQSGSVRYGLKDMETGQHMLSLKVWDVYNNSSIAYTEFIVAESATLALDHVLNYPNPFTTSTSFMFDHNQPFSSLEVLVQIFTISGKLVKTIDVIVFSDGYHSEPIPWDGRDDFGDRIARGVYIYKIRVKTPAGEYAEKIEKLVLLR